MGSCKSSPPAVETPTCDASKKKDEKDTDVGILESGSTGQGPRFVVNSNSHIWRFYDLDKSCVGVCRGENISTGRIKSVETISKSQMKNIERFQHEVEIMKMMDHPNIIKLEEAFENHQNIYLVKERCIGGDLFDRITERKHFTEVQAAITMKQIVQATHYMHSKFVCHRNLKPENFLFKQVTAIEKASLKMTDFGLSKVFQPHEDLTSNVGTPCYVSPQVLAGRYDQSTDLWSIGVILFVMLCGYPPFWGESDAEVLSKVRLGKFSFVPADWKGVSEDAKELIRHLLKMNPKDRHTAEQALNSTWVKNKAPQVVVNLKQSVMDNMKGFCSTNKLKQAAMQVIAGSLDEDEIKDLKNIFLSFDKNGDGFVTVSELKEAIEKSNLYNIPTDFTAFMRHAESHGRLGFEYTEFLAAVLDKNPISEEGNLGHAFRVLCKSDKDGNGNIDFEEFCAMMRDQERKSDKDGKGNIDFEELSDKDGNGNIDFEELCAMMRDQER